MNMPVLGKHVSGRRKIFYSWWMVIAMAILNFISGHECRHSQLV
jgi:hypothetical protein